MKKFINGINTAAGFNISETKPVDDRLVVESLSDLTSAALFYAYPGIIVAVESEEYNLYVWNGLDRTDINNWKPAGLEEFSTVNLQSLTDLKNYSGNLKYARIVTGRKEGLFKYDSLLTQFDEALTIESLVKSGGWTRIYEPKKLYSSWWHPEDGSEHEDLQALQYAVNYAASIGGAEIFTKTDEEYDIKHPIVAYKKDNVKIRNYGTINNIESVFDSSKYVGINSIICTGRVTLSDFEGSVLYFGLVDEVVGNRVYITDLNQPSPQPLVFKSIDTDIISDFSGYLSAGRTRVFGLLGNSIGGANEINIGLDSLAGTTKAAYLLSFGQEVASPNRWYLEVQDIDGNTQDIANFTNDGFGLSAGDGIYVQNTVGVSNSADELWGPGYLNRDGVSNFDLEPVLRGSIVKLSTSADYTNFSEGELVLLRTKRDYVWRFSSDRSFAPAYVSLNIIENIDSTGKIKLKYSIHDFGSVFYDLQIVKFLEDRIIPRSTTHPFFPDGIPLGGVYGFEFTGPGKVTTAYPTTVLSNGSPCLNCLFEFNVDGGGSAIVTNAFCHSTYKVNKPITLYDVIASIAIGSCDSNIELDTVYMINAPGVNSLKDIRYLLYPHESSININIHIKNIIVDSEYQDSLILAGWDGYGITIKVDNFSVYRKNESIRNPSFASIALGRPASPRGIGIYNSFRGNNTIILKGSAPYATNVVSLEDSTITDFFGQSGDIIDIQFDGASSIPILIGENQKHNVIKLVGTRKERRVGIERILPYSGDTSKTLVELSRDYDMFVFGAETSVVMEIATAGAWKTLFSSSPTAAIIADGVLPDQYAIVLDVDPSGATVQEFDPQADFVVGPESPILVEAGAGSTSNVVSGYVANEVDKSIGEKVYIDNGSNNIEFLDHKYHILKSFFAKTFFSNTTVYDSNYGTRPAGGYLMTTAAKKTVVSGTDRWPTLNPVTKRFSAVRLDAATTGGIFIVPVNSLKAGDIFEHTLFAKIFGTTDKDKIILIQFVTAGSDFNDSSFLFTIKGYSNYDSLHGNAYVHKDHLEVFIKTRFQINSGSSASLLGTCTVNGVTENIQKTISFTPNPKNNTALLRNFVACYYADDFTPQTVSLPSYSTDEDFANYESFFEGFSVEDNTEDRIVIDSLLVTHQRISQSN